MNPVLESTNNNMSIISDILNKSKKKKTFPDVFKDDGRPIRDKLEIADKFNLYFTKIGLNLAEKIVIPQNKNFIDYMKKTQTTHFTFSEIKNSTVEKSLINLRTNVVMDGMECLPSCLNQSKQF